MTVQSVTAQNVLLLLWAVIPPIAVLIGAYFFLRAGRRWENRHKR